MTAQTSLQRSLTNGPSKFDLMLALFDKDRKVSFTDEHGMKYEATISMIEAEDGSSESWNLKGSTVLQSAGGSGGSLRTIHYRFIGYFHTGNRKGHLILV